MRLYLLRHASALEHADDARRPLSAEGKQTLARLCARLKPLEDFKPMPLWHSPLVRSVETAKLFKEGMQWKRASLSMCSGLQPDDDPADLGAALSKLDKDLILVGHEPHLGRLASLLLTGHPRSSLIKFKKGALLCLERKDDPDTGQKSPKWRLRWLLSPELLGA